MSRIRMAVEIRNESGAPLQLVHDELASGEWTPGWLPSGPSTIAPGTTGEWRAEGDLFLVPTTGTEGTVVYSVGGDPGRQLHVHFNSPLIESQYGNTFHVFAPPGFEAATSGGQGHSARLVIRFRDSVRRAVPGFLPSVNGFAFGNSWSSGLPVITVGRLWNLLREELGGPADDILGIAPIDDDFLPLTDASAGLCGGMVFAAMDYFAAGQNPPAVTAAPTSADDPLFQFIRDRLVDSFDIFGGGHRWLAYSSPHYPNGDEGFIQTLGLARGRSWVTYRDEWPKIRDDIDGGRLSPIGLVQTDSLDVGGNHQVLGYAYHQDGQHVRLWVYDPNEAGNDGAALDFDVTDTTGEVHVNRIGHTSSRRVFAFFRTDGYAAHGPPGGRPLTIRQALGRVSGRYHGRLPADAGLVRPASLRGWLGSF